MNPLINIIQEKRGYTQQLVIEALYEILSRPELHKRVERSVLERSVKPLIEALKRKDLYRNTRKHIISLLERIGDERTVESLIRTMESLIYTIREKGELSPKDFEILCDLRRLAVIIGACAGCKVEFEWMVEPLIEALKRKDVCPKYRERIISLLKMIGDERAIEPLIEIVESKESSRESAGHALGEIVPNLYRAGKLDPEVVARVVSALKGKEFKWDLGEIGLATGDAELLIIRLEAASTDVSVSSEAYMQYARALEKAGDKRAVKPLIELATKFLEEMLDARRKGMEARSEEIEEMLTRAETTLMSKGMELARIAIRIDPEEAYSEALKCGDTYILKLASEALKKNINRKK